MNRSVRLVPFALLAAATFAQQEPERVRVETSLLVQATAGNAAPPLEVLLQELMNSEPVKQALLQALQSSLPKDAAASDFVLLGWSQRVLTPTSNLAELAMAFSAHTAPAIPPAAADAIARALGERIDAVVARPRAQALERALRLAEAGRSDAERRIDEAERRLESLGIDTFAADQAALSDLLRQMPQVELDLRTEEAVSAQLQQQLDAARTTAAKTAERLEQLEGAAAEIQRSNGLSAALAAQKAQAERGRQAFLEAQRALDAVQEQATASSLALQRHRSRTSVLRDMTAELQKHVAAGAAGARAHAAAERDYTAALDALAAARASCAAAQLEAAALPTVDVRPWR